MPTQVDERVYVSGQIGLIPASMTFPSPQSLAIETALCFQHADRIKRVLAANTGGDWEGHPQLILYWLANVADIPSVRAACQVYEQVRTTQ
jgi:diphthine-ammonia ligase